MSEKAEELETLEEQLRAELEVVEAELKQVWDRARANEQVREERSRPQPPQELQVITHSGDGMQFKGEHQNVHVIRT